MTETETIKAMDERGQGIQVVYSPRMTPARMKEEFDRGEEIWLKLLRENRPISKDFCRAMLALMEGKDAG